MVTTHLFLISIAAICCAFATAASAQTYPAKPVRIVVAFAPGGPADVMARLIGNRLAATLGQPFVIENRPGAGGTIGARAVAVAEADGHTLLLANTSTLVIGPVVYKNVGYDPAKSFAAVALLGTTSNVLVVHPSVAARSVGELIALAKAQPGKLNYASPGSGTPPHLIGEMLKLKTGTEIVHVPYKGGGPSMQAVVAGEVQMTFENPSVSLPLVQGGQVRGLAVTSEKRNPQAPDVPTMIEGGVADFVSLSFTGMAAPAGTPAEILARLNAAINDGLKSAEIEAAFAKLAVEPRIGSPDDFAAFLTRERERWAPVIKAAGVKVE
ncbi:MAG: Bug family tripartite tricarboxylate transporter substrate binding protein [Xanthobacteraceae bacterium]